MARSKLGRTTLGLFALALGLMAILASGAQAEPGARWLILSIDGTTRTDASALNAQVQIKEIIGGTRALSTKIGGASVRFDATGAELVGLKLEGEGKVTTGFKVKFTGVTTKINGTASAVCKPLGTSEADGTLETITTNELKGEIVLHTGGVALVQIKPVTGNIFGKLFFGGTCSLPEEVRVITKSTGGTGFFVENPMGFGTLRVEQKVAEQLSLTELWVISETAEHEAFIFGEAVTKLIGAGHEDLKWNGTPG